MFAGSGVSGRIAFATGLPVICMRAHARRRVVCVVLVSDIACERRIAFRADNLMMTHVVLMRQRPDGMDVANRKCQLHRHDSGQHQDRQASGAVSGHYALPRMQML